jgi:O-antigen/teichoic acid export membrane protein
MSTALSDTTVTPAPAESASRIGRNISALAGGQVVTWTMTLLWTIVVPRALGPAGMGVIVTALAVTGVFSILLGLGTRNYLVREIVVNPAEASRLVGTGMILRLVVVPVFALAVFAYAQVAHYAHDTTLVLYLAAAAGVLILLAEPMQAGFQAIERMQYLAYSDVINKSSQGVLGIALVLLGFRATGLAVSWVAVAAAVVLLDAYWLSRYFRIDLRRTGRDVAEMARQSVAYWAFGLFFMIYLWIDSVMLSLMTRSEVVGWYGVPTKLFQTLMFLPVLLSTAWLPRLVTAFEESPARLRQAARTPLELVLVLSAPICAATAILARPAIDLLYGSAYGKAVPVMVILGLCVPPMYANIMLNQVLVAAKRQASWTWVMAGATVVNPLINFGLIKAAENRYGNGAIGAAASLLLTELGIVIVGFVMVGRGVFDRSAARRCVLVAVASAAMWGVAYVARPLGTLESLAAGGLTLVVLAAAFRVLTAEEIAFLRSSLKRVTRRVRSASGAVRGLRP